MVEEDANVEQAFPDIPEAPTYSKLQTSQRKQILDQQIVQFEQEMAGHFSNLRRLRAAYDAAPEGDGGMETRESCRVAANDAVGAIDTIRLAIETTKDEKAAL